MDEVADPYDIWVTCSVNGEQRMRVNTSDQIWKLPDIIEHFSRLLPLQPGDMFSTGAPGGVAVGKANAEALYMKPGDIVECAFEKPAMVLRNRIVAPKYRITKHPADQGAGPPGSAPRVADQRIRRPEQRMRIGIKRLALAGSLGPGAFMTSMLACFRASARVVPGVE